MKKITTFFILVILISFVSCDTVTHYTMRISVDRDPTLIEEQGPEQITTATDGRVYIAGSYKEGGVVKACYWENGTRTDLHKGTGNSNASSITVVGSDVYVAGSYEEDGVTKGVTKACYWKNGTRIDLSSGTGVSASSIAVANSIAVVGSDIYVAGHYGEKGSILTKACYWKNSTRIDLSSGTRASSIAVVGSDVYVAGGYFEDGNFLPKACYWKNNTKINLPGFASTGETVTVDGRRTSFPEGVPTYAESIAVVGSDVYVAGDYYLDGTNHRPCYWKNGKRTDLPFEGSSSITPGRMPELHSTNLTSITVFGADVYVAGYYVTGPYGGEFYKAQYWKNNTRRDLPVGKDYSSRANSIAVVGSVIYVAGYYYSASDPYESRQYKACYWKDTTKIDLPVPSEATESSAFSIVVK